MWLLYFVNNFFINQVEHPAAKLMVLAAEMMEQEVGDGTNFVIILCGALLEGAEDLLRMVIFAIFKSSL